MDKPRWLLTAFVFVPLLDLSISQYEPNWKSLDSRPLPTWFDEAKIGLFLHWGVYSVPSYGPAWFWYMWVIEKDPKIVEFMHKNYKPGFTYPEFASQFTCEFYDPDHWTDIFSASGAKYVVLTTKHHDGYTLWPSKTSWNWNAVDIGPKRDLVGDLANSIRKKTDIRFGVYHSLFDGLNPLYLQDKANHWKTQDFVEFPNHSMCVEEDSDIADTQFPNHSMFVEEDSDIADTQFPNHSMFVEEDSDIADILFSHYRTCIEDVSDNTGIQLPNHSMCVLKCPVKRTVVVNDRWGSGTSCRHGDFYNCQDRYNPKTLQKHKWENAMTLDRVTWPFRRSATLSDILSIQQLISTLTETISCGGNILINVGPTPDGRIPLIFEERLRQLGQWLKVNGEAI
ncbi:alpha-L-fucosidase-like [Limulus polyphemus]|uniref:alpha-L-fucosidase n=1 Tax=Limulus polyphemus TaxID=6850 RepID=A0ABM1TB37_LIMPO|nr:alpha-L-fucosidase-like [Limulus polyphemus]